MRGSWLRGCAAGSQGCCARCPPLREVDFAVVGSPPRHQSSCAGWWVGGFGLRAGSIFFFFF